MVGLEPSTQPNPLTVPSRSERRGSTRTARSSSGGGRLRDTASTWARVNHTIAIGRQPRRLLPPLSLAHAQRQRHGRRSSWGRSALSHRRPCQRVAAFNAGQCTAPVRPLLNCSHRSQCSHGRESTRGLWSLPLRPLCYLSTGLPPLPSFAHPVALASTHVSFWELNHPEQLHRHCRTSGAR